MSVQFDYSSIKKKQSQVISIRQKNNLNFKVFILCWGYFLLLLFLACKQLYGIAHVPSAPLFPSKKLQLNRWRVLLQSPQCAVWVQFRNLGGSLNAVWMPFEKWERSLNVDKQINNKFQNIKTWPQRWWFRVVSFKTDLEPSKSKAQIHLKVKNKNWTGDMCCLCPPLCILSAVWKV